MTDYRLPTNDQLPSTNYNLLLINCYLCGEGLSWLAWFSIGTSIVRT